MSIERGHRVFFSRFLSLYIISQLAINSRIASWFVRHVFIYNRIITNIIELLLFQATCERNKLRRRLIPRPSLAFSFTHAHPPVALPECNLIEAECKLRVAGRSDRVWSGRVWCEARRGGREGRVRQHLSLIIGFRYCAHARARARVFPSKIIGHVRPLSVAID